MIYLIFEDDVDLYFARSRVLERLSLVSTRLPDGAVPTLGPDATGVGHVFWYTVESDAHSLRDLRSLQDWFIRYQLNAVPGVAEVASIAAPCSSTRSTSIPIGCAGMASRSETSSAP
jgi:Cu(I)/Ag(I) efflux system membrane protein CusA/SilA